jgi:hypothetical protein
MTFKFYDMKTFSKFNLLAAIMMAALIFASCEKNDPETEQVEDTPGNIAGLGETEGEPTGTPFRFPDGIEPADKIAGGYSAYNYRSAGISDKQTALRHLQSLRTGTVQTKADGETVLLDTVVGSGYFVEIFMPLRNTTSRSITVTFPAGLIAKSVSGRCQNGVLLKKVAIEVPAGRIYGVLLLMYCGNAHLDPSYSSEEYVFTVVSNSSLITDLCNRLKNRRMNNEEYPLDRNGYAQSDQYNTYVSKLQWILWNLTDYGNPLSEEDITFIEQMEKSN